MISRREFALVTCGVFPAGCSSESGDGTDTDTTEDQAGAAGAADETAAGTEQTEPVSVSTGTSSTGTRFRANSSADQISRIESKTSTNSVWKGDYTPSIPLQERFL